MALYFVAAALAFPGRASAVSAASEPIAIAPPRVEIRVGERLRFEGRWLGIPVGEGWIEVKGITTLNGRPAYYIEAEGRSNQLLSKFYPVQDRIKSYLDVETLQPLQFEKYQREGHYRADEIVMFDYHRRVASYRSLLNQSTKEIPLPEGVHDIISAFYWLRMQPITIDRPVRVPIYSDEKVFETVIKPLKTLMLQLLWRGAFPCVVVEPDARFKGIFVRRSRVVLYVTADEWRLPLFAEVWTPWGRMTGTLDPRSVEAAQRAPSAHADRSERKTRTVGCGSVDGAGSVC